MWIYYHDFILWYILFIQYSIFLIISEKRRKGKQPLASSSAAKKRFGAGDVNYSKAKEWRAWKRNYVDRKTKPDFRFIKFKHSLYWLLKVNKEYSKLYNID